MSTNQPQRSEQGATVIVVAITLLLMIGMSALALDGGRAYNERRATQNGADHAALAAAWAKCNGADNAAAVLAGRQSALNNGFDSALTNIQVDLTEVSNGPDGVVWRATISRTSDTNLAGVIGSPEITVLSVAEARCDSVTWLDGYAVFAGATSCPGWEASLTGADKIINGGVHSNGGLQITGANTEIIGPETSVQGGDPYQQPWPSGLNDVTIPNVLAAAQAISPGTNPSNGSLISSASGEMRGNWINSQGYGTGNNANIVIHTPGVYYSANGISLSNVTLTGAAATHGVTFVSPGQIHITGSGDLKAYAPVGSQLAQWQLGIYSTYGNAPSCTGSTTAIQFSMSSGNWTGVLFAPNGEVKQSLSSGATSNGSVIGWTVDLSGSTFNINWTDNAELGPIFEVDIHK